MGQRFLVHAATGVAHGQSHILTRHKGRVIGAVGFVEDCIASFDGEFAHSADGVAGIDAEIGQDLIDLGS